MERNIKIKQLLKSEFEIDLFQSSINNLSEIDNKLRYHNFCYSIRELSRHFLASLSPDENVFECSWFKIETDNGKPSRNQRIKYAIQGGLSDDTLKSLNYDVKHQNESIKEIKTIIDSLSKYTHINPENYNLTDEEITLHSTEVLETFEGFVNMINDCKNHLKAFLDGIIDEHMIEGVIFNSYENIYSLAPHFSIDYGEVEDYFIDEITDTEIVISVSGNINATLEYGSRSQRKEGDGLDLDVSFPFETKVRYEIDDEFPSSKYTIDEFDVDTSSWYGDDEID